MFSVLFQHLFDSKFSLGFWLSRKIWIVCIWDSYSTTSIRYTIWVSFINQKFECEQEVKRAVKDFLSTAHQPVGKFIEFVFLYSQNLIVLIFVKREEEDIRFCLFTITTSAYASSLWRRWHVHISFNGMRSVQFLKNFCVFPFKFFFSRHSKNNSAKCHNFFTHFYDTIREFSLSLCLENVTFPFWILISISTARFFVFGRRAFLAYYEDSTFCHIISKGIIKFFFLNRIIDLDFFCDEDSSRLSIYGSMLSLNRAIYSDFLHRIWFMIHIVSCIKRDIAITILKSIIKYAKSSISYL